MPAQIATDVSAALGLNIPAAIEIAVEAVFYPAINDPVRLDALMGRYETDERLAGPTVIRRYIFSQDLLNVLSDIKTNRRIPKLKVMEISILEALGNLFYNENDLKTAKKRIAEAISGIHPIKSHYLV